MDPTADAPRSDAPVVVLAGVTEYGEGYPVKIVTEGGREVVRATNQGGYDWTLVDLLQLVDWLKANRPELLR